MKDLILGAGVTGLAAAYASGLPVIEAKQTPGGICSSYSVRPENPPVGPGSYRFEVGGGHWVFGGQADVHEILASFGTWKQYYRKSSVFFPELGIRVPYPLQNHLLYLGKELAEKAVAEMFQERSPEIVTMEDFLLASFGPTLTNLFFGPFHELYTAGLWKSIAPQDAYKSPVDRKAVERGAEGAGSADSGYNISFRYPEEGLGVFCSRMAEKCEVDYGQVVERIDLQARELVLRGGQSIQYRRLLSTLPLCEMTRMAGLAQATVPDPYTSVLVLNIGALRGPSCPDDHWVYVPGSQSGFHRVGFYSNVDDSFLPRGAVGRVSLYVERSFRAGHRPNEAEIDAYAHEVLQELRDWGFIWEAEVVSPSWVEHAYTWTLPASRWREESVSTLASAGIQMLGRYGTWRFQGIADSIRDGLQVGAAWRRQEIG